MSVLLNKFLTKDLQRTYKYRVIFPATVDIISIQPEQITLPVPNFETQIYRRRGGEGKFHYSYYTIDDFSLSLTESQDGGALKAITDWKSQMRGPNGTFRYPVEFEEDIEVQILSGLNQVHTSIIYKGCWPGETSPIGMQAGEDSGVIIQQSFAVNGVRIEDSANLFSAFFSNPEFALPQSAQDIRRRFDI